MSAAGSEPDTQNGFVPQEIGFQDRQATARYQINVADVQDAVQQALSRLDGVVPTADVLGTALAGTASEDIRAAVLGIIAWAEQARPAFMLRRTPSA